MRDYGKVSPQFWTGTTGRRIRALGIEAQVVALYLVTCPSASMIGLYYLPLPTLAHETGIPLEGASKALRSLSEVGFADYDHASEVVLVYAMARHQIGETVVRADKRHTGLVREAQKLTHSSLFAQWYERYRVPFHLPEMTSSASPFQAPSKPHRSQEQEQEHEKEQEYDQSSRAHARGPLTLSPPPSPTVVPTSGAHSTEEKPAKAKRQKPAPVADTIPLPGTLARKVYDAIAGDPVLAAIVAGPGDAATRWSDPDIYPGVDVLAELKRAGAYAAAHPEKRYTDGRRYVGGWLQRKADEVARAPRPLGGATPSAGAPAKPRPTVEEFEALARRNAARAGGVS